MFEGWPGEKLLIKIVETFQDGLGWTFRPNTVARDAKARAAFF